MPTETVVANRFQDVPTTRTVASARLATWSVESVTTFVLNQVSAEERPFAKESTTKPNATVPADLREILTSNASRNTLVVDTRSVQETYNVWETTAVVHLRSCKLDPSVF